jgi:hypothetical protein
MQMQRRPWGLALGILTGSGVMLLGIWRDVEPLQILVRAGATAAIVGMLIGVLGIIMGETQQEV